MFNLENISTESRWTIAGIYTLLVIATLIRFILCRTKPQKDTTELKLRIRTWWVIVILFSLAIIQSTTSALIFLAFVCFLALKEFLSVVPTRRADRRVLFWAYLAIPFQFYWIHIQWYGMFIVFIPVYMFLFLPTRMILAGETKGFLRAVATIHWGLMTTVFCLSHAAYLLALNPPKTLNLALHPGPQLLLLLILLTQINDVAQFATGKLLGKLKIAPKISPGKTIAGFIGGLTITVALAAIIAPWLTSFIDVKHALVTGAIIAIGGFIGDLTISALKRDIGIKDTGATLPGHGGILDRVDSLTYTAPLFFHFIYYSYF